MAAIGGSSIAAVPADRWLKLATIATAAGAFSAMFGVGGGVVLVPLLIIWLAYGEREAAGTSLAAIAAIALLATVGQGLYGNVDLLEGLSIGIPAVAGVLVGTQVQQLISSAPSRPLFAVLLVAVAIQLLVG